MLPTGRQSARGKGRGGEQRQRDTVKEIFVMFEVCPEGVFGPREAGKRDTDLRARTRFRGVFESVPPRGGESKLRVSMGLETLVSRCRLSPPPPPAIVHRHRLSFFWLIASLAPSTLSFMSV